MDFITVYMPWVLCAVVLLCFFNLLFQLRRLNLAKQKERIVNSMHPELARMYAFWRVSQTLPEAYTMFYRFLQFPIPSLSVTPEQYELLMKEVRSKKCHHSPSKDRECIDHITQTLCNLIFTKR